MPYAILCGHNHGRFVNFEKFVIYLSAKRGQITKHSMVWFFLDSMNRRQSTNVKLVAIINQKNNDQDEEEVVRNTEKDAKIRLRRTCLYGGNA